MSINVDTDAALAEKRVVASRAPGRIKLRVGHRDISSCRPVPTIFPRANFTATSSRIWRISRSLHAAKLFFRLPVLDAVVSCLLC